MNRQSLVLALLVTLGVVLVAGLMAVPTIGQIDAKPDRAPSPKACGTDKINGADENNPFCVGVPR